MFGLKIFQFSGSALTGGRIKGHHDIQHNDTQHNHTQHNDTHNSDTKHNDIQDNSMLMMTLSIKALCKIALFLFWVPLLLTVIQSECYK